MGRKREGGGTAGGGPSTRKGRLVYNRVIPKFLQRLAGPNYTANPVDAKRHGMNSELDLTHDEEEARAKVRQIRERRQLWKDDVEGEIQRLEHDGFNVVQPAVEKPGVSGNGVESCANVIGEQIAATRGESMKKLRVRGGIEKKRVSTGQVANAFGVRNRQKLSFVESESDSESG